MITILYDNGVTQEFIASWGEFDNLFSAINRSNAIYLLETKDRNKVILILSKITSAYFMEMK